MRITLPWSFYRLRQLFARPAAEPPEAVEIVTHESVKNMPFHYRWTDAWLLGAIAFASRDGPAELYRVVWMADAVNHCFMTDEEFESGLARLTAGKWIHEVDGLFETTEAFKHAYGPVERDYMVTVQRDLGKFLDAEHDLDEPLPHPANNLTYPGFSAERLAKAERKYNKAFHKTIREEETREREQAEKAARRWWRRWCREGCE